MTLAHFSLGAVVLLPLLASAVSVLLPAGARRTLGVISAVLITALTLPVVAHVSAGEVLELALGGFAPPTGISLRADGLSVLFLGLTTLVGLFNTLFAATMPSSTGQRVGAPAQGPGSKSGHPAFWPLWMACWAGLNAVFVSGDLFNTYVGLELVSLSAVALVALGGPGSWRAALRYLFVAVLGSLLFLVAVGTILSATGSLDMAQAGTFLQENPDSHPAALLALALISVGLALKIALVPFHAWLIPAHSSAPGSVSPLLSALVLKASLFVLLRCWVWLGAPALTPALGADETAADLVLPLSSLTWVLGIAGAAAIVGGSIMAMRQDRLKPLIAYSTVAQVGYWFLFFPLLTDPASENLAELGVTTLSEQAVKAAAISGTVALALGHGLAKAGLFLAAGYLKELYGTDELDQLRGAGKRHSMLIMTMGLCAISLAGLPVSMGFVGKWQLATAGVGGSHYWIVVVLIVGTLLSAGYLLKALAPLLVQSEADEADPDLPEPAFARAPFAPQLFAFALGLLAVATGFAGVWTSEILEVGAPW